MLIRRRIKALEKARAAAPSAACPACGTRPPEPYVVAFAAPGDPEPPPPCRACGRASVYAVHFDRLG